MAAEAQTLESNTPTVAPKKRRLKPTKSKKPSKKLKAAPAMAKAKKPTKRMKKLFRKRARDYDSDDDEAEDPPVTDAGPRDSGARAALDDDGEDASSGNSSDEESQRRDLDAGGSGRSSGSEGGDEDEEGGAHQGITKFAEGVRAFRVAFLKIMKKSLPDDPLGPILSAHKKLVAEKLAQEEAEHQVKGQAKKEKHLAAERGRVKPANFLDSKEKFLISVATKGVVKLFNAVSKAQNPQKGLDPSRSKDAKVLAKRRKQAFFSELQKSTTKAPNKVSTSTNKGNCNEPGWAPLQDGFMLTHSKLKDWDKMEDSATVAEQDFVSSETSSGEE